ncbi:MAG: carbamoyltransferase N-terminal domain-containing protein, partial [Myxococcota bacterium]|nr:carbamoyltransferase N-terminal domain-containing protein [Myxococcota bacterium]
MNQECIILGWLFEGGDPSAALIRGEEIVALAEEERFTRIKHANNIFPSQAVAFCLAQAGIDIRAVDAIAVGWDATKFPEHMDQAYAAIRATHGPLSAKAIAWQEKNRTRYTEKALLEQINVHLFAGIAEVDRPPVRFIVHHRAHACSAFYLSGFEDACVVTADGHGEEDAAHIWDAGPDGLVDLGQWDLPHSLGWFYTKFTQFFGFRAHDGEGKLMGLAAYGHHDETLFEKLSQVIRLTGDDRVFEITPRFFFGEFDTEVPYTAEWLSLFGQPLGRDDPRLLDQATKNLAYAVQTVLADAGKSLVRLAMEKTGKSRVCVAGGCFMNCKMNGELAAMVGLENFFAMPLAGDNGISIGAALAAREDMGLQWHRKLDHLYFGPDY